jgi:tetraacyldisaccharide 4'-kinase
MKLLKFLFLYPISAVYGLAVRIRNFLFDYGILKSKEFDIPVIAVGNISVGGTGKTPTVEHLIFLLRNKYNIAVLSRGYKRKTKGFVLADETSDVKTIGDEPFQVFLKFPDITVAVDEKRVRGIQKLLNSDKNLDLIILDDAFQHRYVRPALSVLLIDYTQPFFEDHYLPYGRLRDNPEERYRAELILVTKTPPEVKPIDMRIIASELKLRPYQTLYFSAIEYKGLMPVFGNEIFALDEGMLNKQNYAILVVTGIGNPTPIINYCKGFTEKIRVLSFKDHYQYTEKDYKRIVNEFHLMEAENKIIVTTEKDAVRFKVLKIKDPQITKRFFYYPIEMKILNNENAEFNKQVHHYIEKSNEQFRFLTSKKNY